MKSKIHLGLFSALIIALSACNQTDNKDTAEEQMIDTEAIKLEIQQLENDLATAQNAGDVDAAMTYYADDIISYVPMAEADEGIAAVRARMEKRVANRDSTSRPIMFETLEVKAAGDLVVESGRWVLTGDSDEESLHGKYMAVFEKRNGKYVCVREIWNRSTPPKDEDSAKEDMDMGADGEEA